MVRVGQVLGDGGGVLALLLRQTLPQLVHGAEDVEVSVADRQHARGQNCLEKNQRSLNTLFK